jgi:hypothetical protein
MPENASRLFCSKPFTGFEVSGGKAEGDVLAPAPIQGAP